MARRSNPPVVCVTAATVSTKSRKRLKCAEIHFGDNRYELSTNNDGRLFGQFSIPIELTPTRQVTLQYQYDENSWITRGPKTRKIDIKCLFANATNDRLQELAPITQGNIQITFSCQAMTAGLRPSNSLLVQPGTPPMPVESSTLRPTMQDILDDCPRFRILVIGKTGVGKSSLISKIFGIKEAQISDLRPGAAEIEREFMPPDNPRFVLHDSLGFEPGDDKRFDTVKNFIERRRDCSVKDRLHAVWFCIGTPRAGARLLETGAEKFFRERHEILGSIPIVVVFTKFDDIIGGAEMKLIKSNKGKRGQEDIAQMARSEAESSLQQHVDEITQLTRDIPWVAVSTRDRYEHTLSNLIQLNWRLLGADGVPDAQITQAVTVMAQRIDPNLKIRGLIAVGKKRYWKALRSSVAFPGHTIKQCLAVIHTDAVEVWNFYDPGCHLRDDKFRELVIKLSENLQEPTQADAKRGLSLGNFSLTSAISGLVAVIHNPAAPIMIPVAVGLAAVTGIYLVYQNTKTVQQRFIAYIVDLTHIMETLFILTGGEHKRLTRRMIKFAYDAYFESDVRAQARLKIKEYRELDGRDAALELIESLISPERDGNEDMRSYYAERSKLDLSKLDLDRKEDW